MSDPLEHVRRTLAHAQKRVAEAKYEIVKYGGMQPYKAVRDLDSQTGETYKLKLVWEIDVDGVVFDALNAFRATLDQLAYATCIAKPGNKGINTYFPFGEDADDVRRKADQRTGKSREIPQEIFAVMEAFEPHKRGNGALWPLNKIRNTNDHRHLCGTQLSVISMQMNQVRFRNARVQFPRWDNRKKEMVLYVVKPSGRVHYDVKISTSVSFQEPEVLAGKGVIDFLDAVAGEVERVLMAVEAEARRIGLFT